MPKDFANQPYNEVRRADRAMTDDAWIVELLTRAAIGNLATVYESQPFINNNLFVYDQAAHRIYMHTARLGRTRSNIDAHEAVCFSVSEMGRLLPADTALEMSVEYNGVVIFGRGHVLTEPEQQVHALRLLLEKYFKHLRYSQDYRPIMPDELARTAVYAIEIDSWSGKRKKAPEDFPGAFLYTP